MRARVPRDVAAAKKGNERVVNEKLVTQRNSAQDSCANRRSSGAFSLMRQTRAASLWAAYVGPRRTMQCGPRRWLHARPGGKPNWAELVLAWAAK